MLLSGNNDPKQINACVCCLAIVCYSRIGQEDEENLNLQLFFPATAAVHIFDSFHPFYELGTGVQGGKSPTFRSSPGDLCLVANLIKCQV